MSEWRIYLSIKSAILYQFSIIEEKGRKKGISRPLETRKPLKMLDRNFYSPIQRFLDRLRAALYGCSVFYLHGNLLFQSKESPRILKNLCRQFRFINVHVLCKLCCHITDIVRNIDISESRDILRCQVGRVCLNHETVKRNHAYCLLQCFSSAVVTDPPGDSDEKSNVQIRFQCLCIAGKAMHNRTPALFRMLFHPCNEIF